nr:tetratricopeptide repeat protein [uncultured Desulfobacter sp.]
MKSYHFVSHSSADGEEFASDLGDYLMADKPPIDTWIDHRESLSGAGDWDHPIRQAIQKCESLIFVMTRDSVTDNSGCKKELALARQFKKPILPLRFHPETTLPYKIQDKHCIDFTESFKKGLANLRLGLKKLKSPEGKLQDMQYRLERAEHDLRRSDDPIQQARIKGEISYLKEQIREQEHIVDDPERAKADIGKSISAGMDGERRPKRPVTGESKTKFINPPPGVAPTYFQNRYYETQLLGQFLENDVEGLFTVVGRAGIGKTAMVCRLLKYLQAGHLPPKENAQDSHNAFHVDGIVYLSESGSKKLSFPNIFNDLCRLLPDETAKELENVYRDTGLGTSQKMTRLLRAFPRGRYILLLDNFEDKIDIQTLNINDEEINDALNTVLTSEHHGLKIVITTRIAPKELALVEPSKQRRMDLDQGLESPYAENILKKMDTDGNLGLNNAPVELLDKARRRTSGYPRALEALFAILSADRDTTLDEILSDAKSLLPEHVVEKMVGEAYSRLDPDARMVMQALAVYGRPVPGVAVNYMLQPFLAGADGTRILNRLYNMHFIRKEEMKYFLHPVDRAHALSMIPEANPAEGCQPGQSADEVTGSLSVYSLDTLLQRGAQYFKEIRLPREQWKTLEDLAPLLAEFELRCQLQDFETALEVLTKIDFHYLMLWGHSCMVLGYHLRLKGRLINNDLISVNLRMLGLCYDDLGDYKQAIEHLQQDLEISRDIGYRQGEAGALGNLGNCYDSLGDYRQAIEHHQQHLEISRDIGYRQGEAIAFGNLGNCYYSLGDYRQAIEHHQQLLEISRDIGCRPIEANGLGNLGCSFLFNGNLKLAQTALKESISIHEEIRSPNIVEFTVLLGIVYFKSGHYMEAKRYLETAIQKSVLFLEQNDIPEILDLKANAICGLALCNNDKTYVDQAKNTFAKARAITKAKGQIDSVLKLFDFITESDDNAVLTGLRSIAAGTSSQ